MQDAKAVFCAPKDFHRLCGMWRSFLWKNASKKMSQQALLISYFFQQSHCGEKTVAALK